jgi:ABC-type Na+ transport system ATPase subunit NatA
MGSAGELAPDRFTNVRKSGSYRRMTSDHFRIDVRDGGSELSQNRSYRSGSRGFTAPTDWMANVGSGENLMAVDNVFSRQSSVSSAQGDEEALHWAALEKLPTFDRLRTAVLRYVGDDGMKRTEEIDVTKLSIDDRQHIIERILHITEEDNERFLAKLRGRLDRVGIELPAIEVRYEHLTVNADVHQGSRATPSLPNFFKSLIEWPFQVLGATKKTKLNILQDVSGVLKPRRLTLLLGPPQSGRTTLLRALAGRLDTDLYVSGEITYNGHEMQEFVPRKTSAYISQFDLQSPELTVRESLDFYSRLQGVGNRYDMLSELERREREAGIKPEADIDIYLKATSVMGQSSNLVTDYVMRLMGLDICADTIMGDQMRRGISGGQKKRVTTGTPQNARVAPFQPRFTAVAKTCDSHLGTALVTFRPSLKNDRCLLE